MRPCGRLIKWGAGAMVLVLAGIGAITVMDWLGSGATGTVIAPMDQAAYDAYIAEHSDPPRTVAVDADTIGLGNEVVQQSDPPRVYAERPYGEPWEVHGQDIIYPPPPPAPPQTWAGLLGMAVVGMIVALLFLPVVAVLFVLRMRRGSRCTRQESDAAPDEATLLRDIHAGLGRMEQRVEALETILLDRTGRPTSSRM